MSRRPTNFPWVVHSDTLAEDDAGLGGDVIVAKAAAALNIGDYVFISAAKTVNKSAVLADYEKRCGFVVGGTKTFMNVHQTDGDVGKQAAATNEQVVVCVSGFCKAVAGAAISAGDRIIADTGTAGRVNVGAKLTITAGAVAVTSSAANGDIISGHGENQIAGMAWTAAAGAASKFTVHVARA